MTSKKVSNYASQGGKARAKSLNPLERREIARMAAESRWKVSVPRATHNGPLELGGTEMECAVLEDGTRVISERAFARALGSKGGGSHWQRMKTSGIKLPMYVSADNLRPFISDKLLKELSTPIIYITPSGGRAYGIKAEYIPEILEVWLNARDANVLHSTQAHLAPKAEVLMRGLAHVGIIALVDEATGYQDERAKDALAKILEAFVAQEIRKWVKTFPAEFYKELCRLKGVSFSTKMKHPQYFAVLTNDIVYSRLAPGVLEELKRRNPTEPNGRRKYKQHQFLTEEIGHPRLLQHLHTVTHIMKLVEDDNYDGFKVLLDRALPKQRIAPLVDRKDLPPRIKDKNPQQTSLINF